MAEPEEPPFIPNGQPLTETELLELVTITQADVDKAIANADDQLKPFLEAEKDDSAV